MNDSFFPLVAVAILTRRHFAAAGDAFIAVLIFSVLLLTVVVLGYHFTLTTRMQHRRHLYNKIRNQIDTEQDAMNFGESERQTLLNRRGFAVLSQLFDELDDGRRAILCSALEKAGIEAYIKGQFLTENKDFLIEIIHLVGQMRLGVFSGDIVDISYRHKDNIELQYQALLTLSKIGDASGLIRICADATFVQTLSFRSFQQVMFAYAGDRSELYATLLDTPDSYVKRACIRGIGVDENHGLAGRVLPFLDDKDTNLVVDAVRTIGNLGYEPAFQKIEALLNHPRWEVRSVAVLVVAKIGVLEHEDLLIKALQDREWQVRYNAASALCTAKNIESVVQKVQDSKDRYALEMLEYMIQSSVIWRKA